MPVAAVGLRDLCAAVRVRVWAVQVCFIGTAVGTVKLPSLHLQPPSVILQPSRLGLTGAGF